MSSESIDNDAYVDMKDIKVVVIFGLFNHEEYVQEALTSVLSMEYPYPENVTILIFDDASPDNSFEVARNTLQTTQGVKFATALRRSKINVINRQFSYIAKEFSADYYVLCGDDDIQHPKRLVASIHKLVSNSAYAVSTNARLIDAGGQHLGFRHDKDVPVKPQTLAAFLENGIVQTCFGAGLSYSRKIFDVFGPLPTSIRNCDVLIPFRAALLDPEGGDVYIPDPLVSWRQHEKMSTLMASARIQGKQDQAAIHKERWYNNTIGNSLGMLDDVASLAKYDPSRKDLQKIQHKIVSRIILLNRKWVELRDRMARQGIGLL